MRADELKAWRGGKSQAAAAGELGISRNALAMYERGELPIPAKVAEKIGGDRPAAATTAEVRAAVEVMTAGVKPHKTLAGMPPGTVGYLEADWPFGNVWAPGALPKGRWRVVLATPSTLPNGVELVAIEHCSNGVGVPSMIVIGRSNGADPMIDDAPAYGSYRPFRADPNKPSVPFHTDDLTKGKSKAVGRRG